MEEQINQTIDQLVFFLMFQKYMKDVFIVSYTITLIRIIFQNPNVAFAKVLHSVCPSSLDRKKWKLPVITKNFAVAILADLSKALGCICLSRSPH